MSSCEKCWADAHKTFVDPNGFVINHVPDNYRRLMNERRNNPCTPEEQSGEFAKLCPLCKRKTIHQSTGECMVKECESHGHHWIDEFNDHIFVKNLSLEKENRNNNKKNS